MLRNLFLVCLICFSHLQISAQGCATSFPFSAIAEEALHNHAIAYQHFNGISECLNKTLSLNFILVTDEFYQTGVSMTDITNHLNTLNNAFSPICLSFEICNIDTVYEHKYNYWESLLEEEEFQVLFCKENVINVIIVYGTVPYASSIGVIPQALPAKDFIILTKIAIDNPLILVHQMGHLMGLYHTTEVQLGEELVDGSNCKTAGDLVCDTPADIFVAPWYIDQYNVIHCIWDGVPVDANGDLYAPVFGQIMGSPAFPCGYRTNFTVGQYNRMIYYYKQYRGYLR